MSYKKRKEYVEESRNPFDNNVSIQNTSDNLASRGLGNYIRGVVGIGSKGHHNSDWTWLLKRTLLAIGSLGGLFLFITIVELLTK